jgi:hypothetical protein
MTRRARFALAAAVAALLLFLAVRYAGEPNRFTGALLSQTGRALGLEITASGVAEYRLRGVPTVVVRDLVARRPGDATPLLRAERLLLAAPWSTIRARGDVLVADRLELDGPVLDVPALQRWLATRPPSERRMPTLTRGLRVQRGRIVDTGWRVEDLDVELDTLRADAPVRARVRGRYADAATRLPFDLAVAMPRAANDAGMGIAGTVAVERDDWRLPTRIRLSGPLHVGRDGLRIAPLRLSAAATYEKAGEARLPFAIAFNGALQSGDATWTLAPVNLALRGDGPVPDADARGALALGRQLVVQLTGTLPAWPEQWPALPAPLQASAAPLPFRLDYTDAVDLSGVARVHLQRDAARLDARFRLPDIEAWLAADGRGSPLPPVSGRFEAPVLEVADARLEGVEVTLEEPSLDVPARDADDTP